jgi:hypothetical protein
VELTRTDDVHAMGVLTLLRQVVALQEMPSTLMVAVCQVAGLVAAVLLLPSAVVDLAFDTDISTMLLQAMLVAFVAALVVSAWNAERRR